MSEAGVIQSIADDVAALKRLFIFSLTRAGASQAEIADALGVNQSSISRLFNRPADSPKSAKRTRK